MIPHSLWHRPRPHNAMKKTSKKHQKLKSPTDQGVSDKKKNSYLDKETLQVFHCERLDFCFQRLHLANAFVPCLLHLVGVLDDHVVEFHLSLVIYSISKYVSWYYRCLSGREPQKGFVPWFVDSWAFRTKLGSSMLTFQDGSTSGVFATMIRIMFS